MIAMISIRRTGATKKQTITCARIDYLSVCQILETSSTVEYYNVVMMDMDTLKSHDLFITGNIGFPKWARLYNDYK